MSQMRMHALLTTSGRQKSLENTAAGAEIKNFIFNVWFYTYIPL